MKKRNTPKNAPALLALVVTLAALLFGPTLTMSQTKPLRVSIGIDQSGPLFGITKHMFQGQHNYFSWINDHGGIDGVPLKLMWSDTQYKVPLDLEYYKRARDAGSVIHTIAGTPPALALKDLAERDRMALLDASGAIEFMKPPKTIFAPAVPFPYQIAVLLERFLGDWKEKREPRVAFFLWDNPGAKSMLASVPWLKENLRRADELRYEWLGDIYVPIRAPDYSAQLLRVKELKPDLVLISIDPVDTGAAARDAHRLGLTKEMTFGVSNSIAIGPETFKIAGQEALEGFLVPLTYESVNADVPGAAEIRNAQKKYLGYEYDNQCYVSGWLNGIVAVAAIKEAAKRVGVANVDRSAVLDAMFNIKDLSTGGITTPMSFSKDKVYGLKTVRVGKVRGGIIKKVSNWKEAPDCVPGL